MKIPFADILPGLYTDPKTNKDIDFTSINQAPIVLGNVVQIILVLTGILAVIFIIYAGILYAVSQGDPGKTASAKTALINAVFGLVLSAGAYLLISFVARNIQ
ncbi:MAG TPA: hypothetical protein VMR98_01750 [Candidatus Polarisedimenticolaceae bacterium]|nr:hypothetical protein [Candidatus Polarisedimenticolaceae bacterium]